MIVKNYRESKMTTVEFLNIFNREGKDKEEWSKLAQKINDGAINIENIDINVLFSGDINSLWSNYYWICDTLKAYLKKVEPNKISKETFSRMLTLENEDEEYMDILKKIVNSTDKFNEMCFYDYEDNDYDHDKTKSLILEKIDIEKGNLYHCYPSLLFKYGNFNPIFITSLNSPNNWDETDYENVDFRVVLI